MKDYVEILKDKQQEPQNTKLLTAQEVVIEVVPCVLQGFWELPLCPLLNMALQSWPHQGHSGSRLQNCHSTESQFIFSRSIRDDMVQSILREIREEYPQEILLNNIANFAPVLLKMIADVAKNLVSNIFKPPSSLPMFHVLPNEEPLSECLQMSDILPNEEPPSDSPSTPDVPPVDKLPSENVPVLNVLPSEELLSESLPVPNVPCEELSAETASMSEIAETEKYEDLKIKQKKKKRLLPKIKNSVLLLCQTQRN